MVRDAGASVSTVEIDGLPLHPLVVHAAVVMTPLAVLAGWALAVWPGGRWLLRWATPVLAVLAAAAVLLATRSGEELLSDRPFLTSAESPVRDLVRDHQQLGDQLQVLVLVLAAVAVVAWWLLPAVSPLASGRFAHDGRGGRWAVWGTSGALLLTGLLCLVWVVRTGDAGARAVWGL